MILAVKPSKIVLKASGLILQRCWTNADVDGRLASEPSLQSRYT